MKLSKLLHPFALTLLCGALGVSSPVEAQTQLRGKSLFGSIRARHIGPAVMSGRVSDLVADPNDPKTLYVGAAAGGVWKSVNGGADFFPVFDEHTQSIGKIAIDPKEPKTLWVGTGEPWVRNSVSVGDGIYKSTNQGSTWKHLGLEKTERIADIIIDPNSPNTVYVAALGGLWHANEERGVYKTTDGGETWEKVLYVDENTGAADLAMDPNDPNVLWAAMWDFRRSPDYFTSGGPGSGLYKSTDGGKTWNKVTKDLPEGELGRMAIDIAPSNSQMIYLTVECEQKEEKGLYRSEDGGNSWEHVSAGFNVTVRPFYFSRLVVDPVDEKKIYKCGLNLTVSEDKGESFRTVGSGVHSDIHAVWVNPNDNNLVYIGTDGGAYRSLDGGRAFEMFMNLPLSQFYAIAVDNEEPYNIYGGLQDNGSWYGPSNSPGGISNADWKMTNFGDGFHSVPHPGDNNVVYSESQGGNIVRHDKRDGQVKDIKPIAPANEEEYRWNWNTPIYVSPNDPERLFVGAQYLFLSTNRGDSWTRISPDLTTNDPKRQRQKTSGGLSIDNSTAENNTTIYTIAESYKNKDVLWVGTDDGNLQVSADGGKKWINVAENIEGLPAGLWVSSIETGHEDQNVAYVTFDGHRSGDQNVYVFKTTDLGKTWTSVVTPDIKGYAHCIREDVQKSNLLYLGTEFGLYVSIDGGTTWDRFTNNLPKVSVREMVIHPTADALVMGTHGRGAIVIDDIYLLRQLTTDLMAEKFAFMESRPTYLKTFAGGAPFGGAGNFTGSNPDESAKVVYYMSKRHTFGKMYIEVFGPDGTLVKKLPAGKSAGVNIINLPTRKVRPKAAPTNNRMALGASFFGPTLREGTYKVVITKGKEKYETTFDLKGDPKSLYTKEAREVRLDAVYDLYDMTEEVGYLYYKADGLAKQAEAMAEKSKKMAKKLKAFEQKMRDFQESIAAKDGDFYVDEGSVLIREKISKLYFSVINFPGEPSADQKRKVKELREELNEYVKALEDLLKELNKLNAGLAKEELKALTPMTMEEYLKEK